MNEAETRAEHIAPTLKAAGWGVVEGSRVLRDHRITLGQCHAESAVCFGQRPVWGHIHESPSSPV